ncbi:hypothetical protein [Bacillus subtilis]|uniref:hypothetical protein n=1 Tax=Bacillus subtilis TaxID=1423 RepID=UPI0025C937D7|nr:hypothetical protein [Bacillus subtilis]GLI90450.1 hypothetical protein ANABIO4_38020 [Bacillus subtilis]
MINKLNKTTVISGFPGVGKSYFTKQLANRGDKIVLDSDSSEFSWLEPGVRHPDFPTNYIEHIKANLQTADIIFVSSHKVVRDALRVAGVDYTLVYPHKSLKDEYKRRYEARGSDTKFIQMIDKNWDSFIDEIESELFPRLVKLYEGETLADLIVLD